MSLFRNRGVGATIGMGYAAVGLVLIGAVATTIWQVRRTAAVTNRVIELRAPTAQASLGMMNGMNHSLAALRGWMILGKEKFKNERASAWSSEIEPALATMKEFATNWTDPKNLERLEAIESRLTDFKVFQQEIEEIAQSSENMPAMKLLLEQAAPRAKVQAENITRMIDLEAQYDTTAMLNASKASVSAMQLARVVAEQVAADRRYYTKNVIGKLKAEMPDFKAGADYHDTQGAMPLPATFVRESSKALDEDAGYRYDLVSKWNINKKMGLRDSFEERAWQRLGQDPDSPYGEFISSASGVEYRYATADVASVAGCVSCHNNHPDSPKTDFKIGDLMGILVINTQVTDDPKLMEIMMSVANSGGTASSATNVPRELDQMLLRRKGLLGMMADVRGTLGLGLGAIRGYLLSGTPSFKKQFETLWAKNTRRFGDLSENVDLMTSEQHESFELFAKAREQFAPLPPKLFEIRGGDEWNLANKWLGTKAAPTAFAIKENLDEMITSQQSLMDADMVEGKALTTFLMTVEWVLLGAGVFLCTLLGIIITRSITKPINRIIEGLNEGADQVNDAAAQVSTASQQSAEGASEQASSLEETSSALEQMAAMTRTNAENSKEANGLSAQARDAAQAGDTTMHKLNEAMTAINESSGQISKIIKVIEEIAFQTNLLALNAAVEAARAGEHGKGFAVVADEVRNLAQRAAQAAGETTGLIENSVTKARDGTEVAGDVGKALAAIVGDVGKVTDLIDGISKASEEQAQGVDQVNTAVSQMDRVTQQNAAGAEESAAAAEQLSAQANTVKAAVTELAQLIRGGQSYSSQATRPGSGAGKTGKHGRANVASLHPRGSTAPGRTAGVLAASQATPADFSEDFMTLDDDDTGLKDF